MSYTSQSIKVLKGLEACRTRPGMYIGNVNDGTGYHHMLYEVMDNAVDEHLAGHCKNIKIVLDKEGYASIEDDGRGIPIDIHEEEGVSAAIVIMTQLHAGGKFDQDSYKVSGGLHGVGVSVVNALSTKLELTIYRDGKEHFLSFSKGDLVEDIRVVGPSKKTGSKIRFIPDTEIFEDQIGFNLKTLAKRMEELTYLNAGLKITLKDENEGYEKTFFEEKGVQSFVENLAQGKEKLHDTVSFFHKSGNIEVNGSLVWTNSYSEDIKCFTNTIPQKEGGTHLAGLKVGLTRCINSYIEKEEVLVKKMKDLKPSGDDIREGVICVISVHVPEPQFASQTKEKLVSGSVRPVVEAAVCEAFRVWLEENPADSKKIVQRIIEATSAREAARKARDLSRKNKNAGEFSLSMANKLASCSEKDPSKTELFIVEGDSAGGSAKMARNRLFQAVLPLRGKILNVEKASFERMLNYEGIRTLIAVLGTGIGETFDISKIRYNKIIIMTDADIDGSHILTLILTFFFKYMRPILENGFVYVAQPPLYGVKSGQKMNYLLNDRALADFLQERSLDKIKISKDGKILESEGLKDFIRELFSISADVRRRGVVFEAFITTKETELNSQVANKMLDALKRFKDGNWEVEKFEDIFKFKYEKNGLVQFYEINSERIPTNYKKFIEKFNHLWGNGVEIIVNEESTKADNPFLIFDIFKQKGTAGITIQRYKGLGEMNPDDLATTAMKSYLQVRYENEEEANDLINKLMGDDVESRRAFLEEIGPSLESDD